MKAQSQVVVLYFLPIVIIHWYVQFLHCRGIPCRLMINDSLHDRFIMDHSSPVKRLIVIPLLVPLCRKFLPTLTFISLTQYLIKQFNVIRLDLFVLFRSTYQISDIPDSLALPGTPCNNFQGYCDVFQKCRMVCDVIMLKIREISTMLCFSDMLNVSQKYNLLKK